LGLILSGLVGCSPAYRFQYHYVMTDPPGGSEGMEDENVRILIDPVSNKGLLDLTVMNKRTQPIAIVWEQTYFVDPFGQRQQADEAGAGWFFRLQSWSLAGDQIAPGREFRARIHAGKRQTYNPFTVSRQASGAMQVSTSPRSLLPTSGESSAVGEAYQGREFHFILAFRMGTEIARYPFSFRITSVDVESPAKR
jgi:hypothetical protein